MCKKFFLTSFTLVLCLCFIAQGELVNRYSFTDGDANAVDSVGGKDGILEGTATISGNKLILDGGGSAHLPSDTLDPNLESVTIEVWYTENQTGDIWTRLFDFGGTDGGGGGGYAMFCVPHQYGATRFTVATNGFATWQTGEETVSGPIFTGEQTHVVCVWDGPGAEIKIYLNGELAEAGATTMDLSAVLRENAYIGDSSYTSDSYMTGSVDEFRIHDTALTDAEAYASYVTGPDEIPLPLPANPGDGGLVAYYALDGDANDSSINGLDGVIGTVGDVNEAAIFVDGVSGMAIDLLPSANGTQGSYVNLGADPNYFDFTDAITLGAWVNIRSIPDEWRAIISKGDDTWRLSNVGATNRFHFGFCGYGSRPTPHGIDGNIEVEFDEWHYVCGTYDINDGAYLYVDGILDVSLADTAGIAVNTNDVWIGGNNGDTNWKPYRLWDGVIDEVKIYDRALSQGEAMYLTGMRLPADPGSDGLAAAYNFDADANDTSGNGYDGTLMGDALIQDGALVLDGDGDYVQTTLFEPIQAAPDGFTMATWFNTNTIAGQQHILWIGDVAANGYGGEQEAHLTINYYANYSQNLVFNFCDGLENDGKIVNVISSEEFTGVGEWHHIAGVARFDIKDPNNDPNDPNSFTTTGELYLDGTYQVPLMHQYPSHDVLDYKVARDQWNMALRIGVPGVISSRPFNGMIDDVTMYSRPLVEEEVMYLAGLRWPPQPEATGPQPVHSYTFEDGTADDSVGDADGLLIGDANVVSGSLILDGNDDWVELPGDIIAINTLEEVTIEAWYTPTEGANTGYTMLASFGLTNPFQDWMGVDYLMMTSARGDDVSRAAISCFNYEEPWTIENGVNGPEYDDGLLHHMVATVNATELAFYIDGALIGTTELTGDNQLANVSAEQAYLGKAPYNQDPEWAGAIHEFNIYDYALSADDILGLYDTGY